MGEVKKKYIDDEEKKFYREKLIKLREEILGQMKDLSKDTLMKTQKDISGDISGYSIHMADVASDNYEREFSLGLVSNEQDLLLEIESALKRLDDEEYGICLMCNKPISKGRLKVIPYAHYCKKCKEKIEKETSG